MMTSNRPREFYVENEIMDRAIDLIYAMNNKEYYKIKSYLDFES